MKFAEDHNSARYKISGYDDKGVRVNNRLFDTSFVLSPMELIEDWSPATYADFNASHLDALYTLKPDVVLLGTGKVQVFPPPDILKRLAKEHIGFEIMNTQAACRTFNVLMSEDRKVVAGIFID